MAAEDDHAWLDNQSMYDDENDFELSDDSENEGSLYFLEESDVDSDFHFGSQHTNTHNLNTTYPFVDEYDTLSLDHYTADLRQSLPSGEQPSTRRTISPRSIKSQDFDIFVDSDGPEPNPHGRSYYGSNVPALGSVVNDSQFGYQLHRILSRGLDLQPDLIAFPDDYHTVTFEERVLKYYEWNLMEDHFDIWLWAESEGLTRKWTKYQASGFRNILLQLKKMSIANANHHRDFGFQLLGEFSHLIEAHIKALGVENISLSCPAPYIYRFQPTGDDTPKYKRTDFDAVDQRRMDRHFPHHWAEGEECIMNPDTLPRLSNLSWRENILALANEYTANIETMGETEHANVRDYLDRISWQEAMRLRLDIILCYEVVLPVV